MTPLASATQSGHILSQYQASARTVNGAANHRDPVTTSHLPRSSPGPSIAWPSRTTRHSATNFAASAGWGGAAHDAQQRGATRRARRRRALGSGDAVAPRLMPDVILGSALRLPLER